MGGKHEAGQKEGKAGSMYFLKASSKQQRNKDQGISGLPTQNSELVSARRPAGNPGTGVVQAADRKATAKREGAAAEGRAAGRTPVSAVESQSW